MSSKDSEEVLQRSPSNAWNLYVGREICNNVEAGLNREWLVTNGLGGYASGSILGATTRSYHGLLVAALRPPVERTVLVTKMDEEIGFPNRQAIKLGVNEYRDGTIDPQGYNYLESVTLEGDIVCFTYDLGNEFILQKRVWMEYGQNTTYVQYLLLRTLDEELDLATDPTAPRVPPILTVSPFCLYRDHHGFTRGTIDWHFQVENQ